MVLKIIENNKTLGDNYVPGRRSPRTLTKRLERAPAALPGIQSYS